MAELLSEFTARCLDSPVHQWDEEDTLSASGGRSTGHCSCVLRVLCSRLDTWKQDSGSKAMSLSILIDTKSSPSFHSWVRQLLLCNDLDISAAQNNKHVLSGFLACSSARVRLIQAGYGWAEPQAMSPILLGQVAPRGMLLSWQWQHKRDKWKH